MSGTAVVSMYGSMELTTEILLTHLRNEAWSGIVKLFSCTYSINCIGIKLLATFHTYGWTSLAGTD